MARPKKSDQVVEKKKMEFVEVTGKDAETKVYKIANKKVLINKTKCKTQSS